MLTAPTAVLFDLDGTLLDTSHDMVAALNVLCTEESRPVVSHKMARNHVSNGAAGLLRLVWPDFDPARHTGIHQRYLELYAANLCRETRLFPDIENLLARLEATGIPWGIVTNKPDWLTRPLLVELGLLPRAAVVVSGDSLPERKPHPRPVRHALEMAGAAPTGAFYIGDARRDIEAGRAAGTLTVAAAYGYIEPGQDPREWGADHLVHDPSELLPLLLP